MHTCIPISISPLLPSLGEHLFASLALGFKALQFGSIAGANRPKKWKIWKQLTKIPKRTLGQFWNLEGIFNGWLCKIANRKSREA